MVEQIGQKLLKEKVITDEQLQKAIDRQKIHGGSLGHNLIKLGYVTPEAFHLYIEVHPPVPRTLEDTGLEPSFIADLIMKQILFMGKFTIQDLSNTIKLPISIIDPILETLREEKFIEVKGAREHARLTYIYSITGIGKTRAIELFNLCRYKGPAPISLDQYKKMVEAQTIRDIVVDDEVIKKSLSHLVINERFLKRLCTAVNSIKPIFIYGPVGNGKTTIADAIGKILPGTIYIPYSIMVAGQVISVFDPVNHIVSDVKKEIEAIDQRWILIKRPAIMVGGELTLKPLDLEFNSVSKFYEAALQIKSNNGLFIFDDFGRQQINPQHLMNRWIVPLERGVDFMTLHTGMKFDIPFDQIVIFSTNIDPRKIIDEAFLRRIRFKLKVSRPSEEEFEEIFQRACLSNGMIFKRDVFEYLMNNFYKRLGVKMNACHARDLIDQIVDDSYHYDGTPQLTRENIDLAWENYFIEM